MFSILSVVSFSCWSLTLMYKVFQQIINLLINFHRKNSEYVLYF